MKEQSTNKATAAMLLLFAATVMTGKEAMMVSAFSPMPQTTGRLSTTKGINNNNFHVAKPSAPLWATNNNDDYVDAEIISKTTTDINSVDVKKHNPTPAFVQFFQKHFGLAVTEKPKAVMAAMVMAFALMISSPLPSNAAVSGGRLGGSYSPSMRSSRPSVTRVAPSRSSYGSGYSRGFASGVGVGALTRPSYGFGFSPFSYNPFYSPYGYYGGGPGVVTYSRGPGLLPFLITAGVLWTALNSLTASTSTDWFTSDATSEWDMGSSASSALGPGVSVMKLSVALDVSNRDDPNSILSVLNRLSRTAKTDSRVGIQNLTSQVALELLRRKSTFVSASSEYKHFRSRDQTKATREYNRISVRERGKFESENVSKYGGVDYSTYVRPGASNNNNGKATMAVVTLVLAIDGDSTKIPSNLQSTADVEAALRKVATDSKVDDCLQSAEILWTPEDRTETLSFRDVIADYPDLQAI